MLSYYEKLKDPRWQKKRLEILQRDNFTCRFCGDSKSHLHVHHITYFKDMEPWDYTPLFLITACTKCHHLETEYGADDQKIVIAQLVQFGFNCNDFASLAYLFDDDPKDKIKKKFRDFVFSLYKQIGK